MPLTQPRKRFIYSTDLLVLFLSTGVVLTFFDILFVEGLACGMFFTFTLIYYRSLFFSISIRTLLLFLFSLQFLLGPVLAYNVSSYDAGKYFMAVSVEQYMSFAMPAIIVTAFFLFLPLSREKNVEVLDIESVKASLKQKPNIGPILLFIGVTFSFLGSFAPGGFEFILYILSYLKFVGVYYILLSGKQFRLLYLVIAYFIVALSSIQAGMFHDLIIWMIILLPVLVQSYKIKRTIVVFYMVLGVFVVLNIQLVKEEYRSELSNVSKEKRLGYFLDTVMSYSDDDDQRPFSEAVADHITRFNQGWILGRVMYTVPHLVDFSNGESLWNSVKSAFLPRILFPDKLKAGSNPYFTKFTGIEVARNTSMGIGIFELSFLNYGYYGLLIIAIYALSINLIITKLGKVSIHRPTVLLWAPLIFLYTVRPDADFYTTFNHLLKSMVVITVIYFQFKNTVMPFNWMPRSTT